MTCVCELSHCGHPASLEPSDPRCTNPRDGADQYCKYCREHRAAAKIAQHQAQERNGQGSE